MWKVLCEVRYVAMGQRDEICIIHCNACDATSRDESLKRSIRRVSCFPSILHPRLFIDTNLN
jgi:hypothetical protein